MKGRLLLLTAVLSAAIAPSPAATTSEREVHPNIVFILADDLGFMDIGANNPTTFYETPNLDKLATQGVRFTQAYAACPVCSPTRASILTGKYPARLKLTNFIGGHRTGKLTPAEYRDHLPLEEVTLAEALKEAGYVTGFFGKWHLGSGTYTPEAQGFDVNAGGTGAGSPASYFSPYRNAKLPDGPPGEFLPERLTREVVRFMETNAEGPFLAYLSHYSVHIPLQARKEVVAKYEVKAASLPAGTGPKFLPEGRNQARQVQDHPVYAAMVQGLDESVGTVMRKLDELGIAERTIVIFFSDNGGLSTAEGTPTSNVPLRGGKGWLYEGGIREPLLIKWPGHSRKGTVVATPVISTDFYPTLLEMAGLPRRPQQHVDGVSLVPLIESGKAPERSALFWHYPHYSNQGGGQVCAVRAGDWKLIRSFEGNPFELFNLRDDLGETTNLAEQNPQKVTELNEKLDAFLGATKAELPKPNASWKPANQN